jgi:hypothetical protein
MLLTGNNTIIPPAGIEGTMSARALGILLVGLYLSCNALLPSVAWSQSGSAPPAANLDTSPIGKVLTVAGSAHIEHSAAVLVQVNAPPSGVQLTKVGDLVYRGDVVQTGADGALGITFADGSSFNVSANARMEINEFIYDPKGQSNSSLLSLTRGTFTFIAGNVAHTGDMKVDTPVGTMGIRGTAPRVEILDDGTVKFTTLVEQKK